MVPCSKGARGLGGNAFDTLEACDLKASRAYTKGDWVPRDSPLISEDVGEPIWGRFHDMFNSELEASNASCRAAMASWIWRPLACTLRDFDAEDFLDQLRDKHVLLVGDSVTRQWHGALRALLGNRTVMPAVTNSLQMAGLHAKGTGKKETLSKPPSQCTQSCRHDVCARVSWPPQVMVRKNWLCCNAPCDRHECCRTIRQYYAPRTNTTFTLHESETLVDLQAATLVANRRLPDLPADCLLRLNKYEEEEATNEEAVLKCRQAPWNHHLPSVDVLILNTGHHIHKHGDVQFGRYADMVDVVLDDVAAHIRSEALFIYRTTNHGFYWVPRKSDCDALRCRGPRRRVVSNATLTQDTFNWDGPARNEYHWSMKLAQHPTLAPRATVLDILPSSDWRQDAVSSDCRNICSVFLLIIISVGDFTLGSCGSCGFLWRDQHHHGGRLSGVIQRRASPSPCSLGSGVAELASSQRNPHEFVRVRGAA